MKSKDQQFLLYLRKNFGIDTTWGEFRKNMVSGKFKNFEFDRVVENHLFEKTDGMSLKYIKYHPETLTRILNRYAEKEAISYSILYMLVRFQESGKDIDLKKYYCSDFLVCLQSYLNNKESPFNLIKGEYFGIALVNPDENMDSFIRSSGLEIIPLVNYRRSFITSNSGRRGFLVKMKDYFRYGGMVVFSKNVSIISENFGIWRNNVVGNANNLVI